MPRCPRCIDRGVVNRRPEPYHTTFFLCSALDCTVCAEQVIFGYVSIGFVSVTVFQSVGWDGCPRRIYKWHFLGSFAALTVLLLQLKLGQRRTPSRVR